MPTPVLVKKAGNAGAAGADALGQRALRVEFQLQLAGQIELLEQLVLADIGRDHLLDLAASPAAAQAEIVDAGIVGDDGEVLDAGLAHRVDQVLGNAAQAEAAGHDRHAVEEPVERRFGVGIDFVHEMRPEWRTKALTVLNEDEGIIRRNLRNASMSGLWAFGRLGSPRTAVKPRIACERRWQHRPEDGLESVKKTEQVAGVGTAGALPAPF